MLFPRQAVPVHRKMQSKADSRKSKQAALYTTGWEEEDDDEEVERPKASAAEGKVSKKTSSKRNWEGV